MSSSRNRYPSNDQFETLRSKARRQKRGFSRIMTAAGFTQKEGTTGSSRTDWLVASR